MKNRMSDVRDHLVAMMERLGDKEADAVDVSKAKALSELAGAYTDTIRVEIKARELAGMERTLPAPLALKEIGQDG